MTQARILREKLARLSDGSPAHVLDLFSGCGGMSVGCKLAGCEIVGGVEIDPIAVASHARNLHPHGPLEVHAKPRDITKVNPLRLLEEMCPGRNPQRAVDILVGGPPCQSFARVGRAKLREIMDHPEAFLKDPRAELYKHYLEFIEALLPLAVVVENVPDVLNFGGINIFEIMCDQLERLGYVCRYGLLNAVHYGVPQMRERAFLFALHEVTEAVPALPAPTRSAVLPRGYQGSRDVALKFVDMFCCEHFVEQRPLSGHLPAAVTAQEAMIDLPPITAHLTGELRRGARRLNSPLPLLHAEPPNDYTRLMRCWPGFESDGYVYDHEIRYLPRDYEIFARMKPGDQYPEAYRVALQIRDEEVARLERETGQRIRPGTAAFERITKRRVPPYDPGKFPNKWRKMDAKAPSRTLMAHIGKDTYSHIHYDSRQRRTISVREAARLQSFPDGFRFSGTMNPAFRQIGNAVPPLLAYHISSAILIKLTGRKTRASAAARPQGEAALSAA